MSEITSELARRVRMARASLDLSQEKIAQRMSVSKETVRTIEEGKTWPRQTTLEKLAQALEVTPEYLLGINNPFNQQVLGSSPFPGALRRVA